MPPPSASRVQIQRQSTLLGAAEKAGGGAARAARAGLRDREALGFRSNVSDGRAACAPEGA